MRGQPEVRAGGCARALAPRLELTEGRTSPTDSMISASKRSNGSHDRQPLWRSPKSEALTWPRTDVTVKGIGCGCGGSLYSNVMFLT